MKKLLYILYFFITQTILIRGKCDKKGEYLVIGKDEDGNETKTCLKCIENCYRCVDGKTCKICDENHYLKYLNLTCFPYCKIQKCEKCHSENATCSKCITAHGLVDNTCSPCKVSNCKFCDGNISKCSLCNDFYKYNTINNICERCVQPYCKNCNVI